MTRYEHDPVLDQNKGFPAPGSFSDSCRYLQNKIMSGMQWFFLCYPVAAQSPPISISLDIGFGNVWRSAKDLILFSMQVFKIQNKYYKYLWQYSFFFTWKWDLISSHKNLQVKIVYDNHTQSFFSMYGQKTKANYTTWFYSVRANNKINQEEKCYNEKKNKNCQNPKKL